ncbi:ferrochelatase [Roseospirillum parvum]|uniref:Ferrochelatase n=1 Tax=Roseospirillum parvum TaxID=83401 RepID=A0A1G8DPW0_9PROT|nr:ferrochelatase [Roseospirillum parvum]SDH59440.1 ferrochelatase [Roseospirillum parvum]
MKRLAVVVFNLGGPDGLDAIEPFLFNLFSDPAIINLPLIIRKPLAWYIARKRAPIAREIYSKIGGRSPLVDQTQAQAEALEESLADLADEVRVFVAMRYWHPLVPEAVRAVQAFDPDHVVLLPLYPQYSTSTTESSFAAWHKYARRAGLAPPTQEICCYPINDGWLEAQASLITTTIEDMRRRDGTDKPFRVLFSAHGLPKKVIERGDPYQWQVEETARAVVGALDIPDLDWTVCYQSRVGPLEWIGPSTEEEIARAGVDKVALIVVPIAFVSEHSETLVELDIEYGELAEASGVPAYYRVPAVGIDQRFIDGLGRLVRRIVRRAGHTCRTRGPRNCPIENKRCPNTPPGRSAPTRAAS